MAEPGIHAAQAPKPVGHYPHARRAGNTLYISGTGPRDPQTNGVPGNVFDSQDRLVAYDIIAQTHAVFANIERILNASGASWNDVVDVTVYLANLQQDFTAYNHIWAEYFPDPDAAPCRTTVGITALPAPIAIEFKCIAILKD